MRGNYSLILKAVCDELKSHDNFIIITHKRPDGDTLGSAFALKEILRLMGKSAEVVNEDKIGKKFFTLTEGRDTLSTETDGEYIIAIDVADSELMGPTIKSKFGHRVDISIDHHATNKKYAKMNVVFPEFSATAEIIFELSKELNIKINKRIAECIYTALITDTGCFMYANTNADSHRRAAELIETGIDFITINERFFMQKSLPAIELEKHIYNTMSLHFNDRVALASITRKDLEIAGASESEIEGLSNMLREIETVKVSVLIREIQDGVKVSMRSKGDVNVAAICEVFGGGGHKGAAGCSFKDKSIKEVKDIVLKEIEKRL